MKTSKNSFSVEKRPENEAARKVVSFSHESNKTDLSTIIDVNSYRNIGLKTENESITNSTPRNFEKVQKESSYSFVVDWQIPQLSERN
jgi:hypothetical protein